MALVLSGAGAPPAPASTWAAPARADGEPLDGLRHGLGSLAHFGAAYLSALNLPVVPAVAPALASAPSLGPPSRPRLRPRDRATGARAPPCLRLAPSYELIS
jgi:hypothetical protein